MRLEQVEPGELKTCCGISNKMCYWLGKYTDLLKELHPKLFPILQNAEVCLISISSKEMETLAIIFEAEQTDWRD